MKQIFIFVALMSLGLEAKVNLVQEDLTVEQVEKVKRFYKTHLQKHCAYTATNFAKMHTQSEWDSMKNHGRFVDEILKICPKSSRVVAKILAKTHGKENFEYLLKFAVQYAKETGKFPPC